MSAVDRKGLVPLEKLLDRTKSMYKLVILAARRALELSNGAPPLIDINPKTKPSIISLWEIAEGKVSFRLAPKKKS